MMNTKKSMFSANNDDEISQIIEDLFGDKYADSNDRKRGCEELVYTSQETKPIRHWKLKNHVMVVPNFTLSKDPIAGVIDGLDKPTDFIQDNNRKYCLSIRCTYMPPKGNKI